MDLWKEQFKVDETEHNSISDRVLDTDFKDYVREVRDLVIRISEDPALSEEVKTKTLSDISENYFAVLGEREAELIQIKNLIIALKQLRLKTDLSELEKLLPDVDGQLNYIRSAVGK